VQGTTNLGWTAGRKNQGSLSVLNTETNEAQVLGAIWSGTLVLDKASLTEGEPIKGTFSARWYEVKGGKDPASCQDGETQTKDGVTYYCKGGKWVAKK